MLLRYYQRTTEFNESLPIRTMQLLKVAIPLHMVIGTLMLTNNDIFPPDNSHSDHFYYYLQIPQKGKLIW